MSQISSNQITESNQKRSGNSNQNQLKNLKPSNTNEDLCKSSRSILSSVSSSSISTFNTQSTSLLLPNISNLTTNANYIIPFSLNTAVTGSSPSNSPSPSPMDSQASLNSSSSLNLLAFTNSNLNNKTSKLSYSSADSSSSAPNSPPPNYDEVFDVATLNGSLISTQIQQQTNSGFFNNDSQSTIK